MVSGWRIVVLARLLAGGAMLLVALRRRGLRQGTSEMVESVPALERRRIMLTGRGALETLAMVED